MISRYFETSPYNLLIDIQTLCEFVLKNHRKLEGKSIYEFVLHFENFDISYILDFYWKIKDLLLKSILYDDWEIQKNKFVDAVNHYIFSASDFVPKNMKSIPYYDISDLKYPILVHNTGIEVDDIDRVNQIIHYIKNGSRRMICLSLQDFDYQIFYEENRSHTIKFIYGTLDPIKVRIINHEDVYSQGPMKVEYNNICYKRRLYTLEEFMVLTNRYNEIVYSINNQPFFPIGILCEELPTNEEIRVAEELKVPIFYCAKRGSKKVPLSKQKQLIQRYEWQIANMNLFLEEK